MSCDFTNDHQNRLFIVNLYLLSLVVPEINNDLSCQINKSPNKSGNSFNLHLNDVSVFAYLQMIVYVYALISNR